MNVPQLTDERLQALIKKIKSSFEPMYVPVMPEKYAIVNECFPNVDEKVKKDGGEIVYGWQLWKGTLITEAEYHAVWKSPAGELVDITPKQPPIKEILFIQDDNVKYTGVQIDNIRIRNNNNLVINDYIDVHRALFRLMNKGERAQSYKLSFTEREMQLYSALREMAFNLEMFAISEGNLDSQCYCNSGYKYDNCHRNKLENMIYESKL